MALVHPATIIVSGGTGSGKTFLTRRILQYSDSLFSNLPSDPKILWCYGIEQPWFREPLPSRRMRFKNELPDENFIRSAAPDVIVIDDMMSEKASDPLTHNLFTKLSHHLNMTVVFITQNLYEKGQVGLKRNAHYIFMMRNPSDKSQIATLGRQLFPRGKRDLHHFYESYDDATNRKFGYLLIDVSPHCEEILKLRTRILPDEGPTVVYVPKDE